MNVEKIYKECYRIRSFEKKVEQEFSNGKLRGTTHGCIGQEIIPVLAMEFINKETDYVVGTHRCHGQVLAYTGDTYRLACEMMGRKDGFVKGIGGSQHIKVDKYLTNGITGGMVTVGTGIALGIKKTAEDAIVTSFFGDGGFNEGYVQESLNLAASLELPILYICENNHYAMSTPTVKYSAPDFGTRVTSLGMYYIMSDTAEPQKLCNDMEEAFSYVRKFRKPCVIDVHTARLCGHSKSDSMEYMSNEEKQKNIENDPIAWLERNIQNSARLSIQQQIAKEINDAFDKAYICEEILEF